MSGEQEELYSYDPTALADYEPQYQQSPQTVGVGGRLNTPPHPASPRVSISILPPGPTVGVGTNMNPADHITVLVGGTHGLRAQVDILRHQLIRIDPPSGTRHLHGPLQTEKESNLPNDSPREEKNPTCPSSKYTFLPQQWW